MKSFLGKQAASVAPYVPGEQPQGKQYIKLNTNECPYPPSPLVEASIASFNSGDLRYYPDPGMKALHLEMATRYGLPASRVIAGGGSDELLGFAFMAFSDRGDKVYFPDITYGFYQVYANLFGLEPVEISLQDDFSIRVPDYIGLGGNLYIANPNAPTGIVLDPAEIETILQGNPNRVVVVDEAYIDFAPGKSCIPLISRYDNLLVVQTFSKSRSLAGMRIGFAFGQEGLIQGLDRIKFSFNPYNIDRISAGVGIASIRDQSYLKNTVEKVIATRDRVYRALIGFGYQVLPSSANFLFAAHPNASGEELYQKLRDKGILVRHFNKPRINRHVRISIGNDHEMDQCLQVLKEI